MPAGTKESMQAMQFDRYGPPEVLQLVTAAECDNLLRRGWPGCTALVYGHLGDGNLHLIVHLPSVAEQPKHAIETAICAVVRRYNGSVSAEHGIGTLKRPVPGHTRSEAELAAMRAIKAALDPKNILNPGKLR